MVFMGVLNSIAYQGLGDHSIDDGSAKSSYVFTNNIALILQINMLPVMQCMANINTYAAEKTIVVSEIKEGLYSVWAYLIAATLAPLPLMAGAIFSGMITMWLIGTGAVSD